MTLICFDINIGIKIIQVEKVWGIKWRLNDFSRLRVLTWASVCLSVIAYRLWTCEIWILLKAGSHPWRQAITIHQGLGRRNWKLKLCKSPQRFASLAQTSTKVVFISLPNHPSSQTILASPYTRRQRGKKVPQTILASLPPPPPLTGNAQDMETTHFKKGLPLGLLQRRVQWYFDVQMEDKIIEILSN